MDLITLADLPALEGSDPKPLTTITIGRLDDNLRDPRYGKFSITQADVDSWKRNLAGVMGGEVSFDFDHSSDRGQGTRASGWVKGIHQTGTAQGSLITADFQFSKRGAKAVRNGDYKYTSPTFVENYTDEHGEKHGKALIGGALTNRPVLRKGMPTLSLSRDEFEGVAVPSTARDSRPRMDLSEVAKLLGLDENADLASVLTGVLTLEKASPPSPSRVPGNPTSSRPTKSGRTSGNGPNAKAAKKARKLAKKQANALALSADGDSTTLAAHIAELELKANRGDAAATQLAEDRFTHAYKKALDEGRVAPVQEENLKALHKLDPELAIKTLDSFVRIVPTRPAGSGEGSGQSAPTPQGMDDDRFALHTQATQLAAEKRKADPTLDEAAAYSLAAIEIEDRKFELSNGGF